MTICACRGDERKFVGRAMQCFKRAIPGIFPKWKKRWERCITSGGQYLEWDKPQELFSKGENLVKFLGIFMDKLRTYILTVINEYYCGALLEL
jgi:hypothetical protein